MDGPQGTKGGLVVTHTVSPSLKVHNSKKEDLRDSWRSGAGSDLNEDESSSRYQPPPLIVGLESFLLNQRTP